LVGSIESERQETPDAFKNLFIVIPEPFPRVNAFAPLAVIG